MWKKIIIYTVYKVNGYIVAYKEGQIVSLLYYYVVVNMFFNNMTHTRTTSYNYPIELLIQSTEFAGDTLVLKFWNPYIQQVCILKKTDYMSHVPPVSAVLRSSFITFLQYILPQLVLCTTKLFVCDKVNAIDKKCLLSVSQRFLPCEFNRNIRSSFTMGALIPDTNNVTRRQIIFGDIKASLQVSTSGNL